MILTYQGSYKDHPIVVTRGFVSDPRDGRGEESRSSPLGPVRTERDTWFCFSFPVCPTGISYNLFDNDVPVPYSHSFGQRKEYSFQYWFNVSSFLIFSNLYVCTQVMS